MATTLVENGVITPDHANQEVEEGSSEYESGDGEDSMEEEVQMKRERRKTIRAIQLEIEEAEKEVEDAEHLAADLEARMEEIELAQEQNVEDKVWLNLENLLEEPESGEEGDTGDMEQTQHSLEEPADHIGEDSAKARAAARLERSKSRSRTLSVLSKRNRSSQGGVDQETLAAKLAKLQALNMEDGEEDVGGFASADFTTFRAAPENAGAVTGNFEDIKELAAESHNLVQERKSRVETLKLKLQKQMETFIVEDAENPIRRTSSLHPSTPPPAEHRVIDEDLVVSTYTSAATEPKTPDVKVLDYPSPGVDPSKRQGEVTPKQGMWARMKQAISPRSKRQPWLAVREMDLIYHFNRKEPPIVVRKISPETTTLGPWIRKKEYGFDVLTPDQSPYEFSTPSLDDCYTCLLLVKDAVKQLQQRQQRKGKRNGAPSSTRRHQRLGETGPSLSVQTSMSGGSTGRQSPSPHTPKYRPSPRQSPRPSYGGAGYTHSASPPPGASGSRIQNRAASPVGSGRGGSNGYQRSHSPYDYGYSPDQSGHF